MARFTSLQLTRVLASGRAAKKFTCCHAVTKYSTVTLWCV